MLSPLTRQLIEALTCLQGIGPKSAQRLAFQLLADKSRSKGLALSQALLAAMEQVGHCTHCGIYTEQTVCELCENPKRDARLLCVGESPADVAAIGQSSHHQRRYYVLQGDPSPLDGKGPEEIGIPYLLERLRQEPIQEVILATNSTMEGEATAHYIATHMDRTRIRCSRIAHGVPIGGELEYLDGG